MVGVEVTRDSLANAREAGRRWYQRVPEGIKGLLAACAILGAAWGAGAATADAYNAAATKTFVRVEITEATANLRTDVLELQEVRRAQAADREREQLAKQADRKRWAAVFRSLVSLQAADREPDKRRKADAAAHARAVFNAAVKADDELEDAMEAALDSRPPWRR